MLVPALAWAAMLAVPAFAAQQPFLATSEPVSNVPVSLAPDAVLAGRFLHITDMHIDWHYKEGSSVVSTCHRNSPHRKHGGSWRAGHWGAGISDCDSPPRLVNHTLSWIRDNWNVSAATGSDNDIPSAMFDFIIWTGDSARHDEDTRLARTDSEIAESNKWAIAAVESTFPGTPVVPNIGNNDINLHNTMVPGPSDETRRFAELWKHHLLEESIETVIQGGYFSKDVLSDRLGVISLNTLYFYDSNKAVNGCPRRRRKGQVDPGTLQLEWLARELARFRRRNMQVHIIGHVPPTAGNYFSACYDVYTELVLRFQDTVVGQHFGHMNVDALFVQESTAVSKKLVDIDESYAGIATGHGIENDLRHDYALLPGPARANMDYYGAFFVNPSVVPTYYPSLRVWTYNTTPTRENRPFSVEGPGLDQLSDEELNDVLYDTEDALESEPDMGALKRSHRRPARKHRRKHRKLPRYTSEFSPSRSNTFLSLLGYSEWVLNIDRANSDYERMSKKAGHEAAETLRPEFELEYVTYEENTLWHEFIDTLDDDCAPDFHHHESPAEHHVPVPAALLKRHLKKYNLGTPFHRSTTDGVCRISRPLRGTTMYGLSDMTLNSIMYLGRHLALNDDLWDAFVRRLYTSSESKSK